VKFPTHAGRHAIGPGALDQYATRKRIACLSNPGAPNGASGRVFARHQAEIGHQLASIGEASKVADRDAQRASRIMPITQAPEFEIYEEPTMDHRCCVRYLGIEQMTPLQIKF
jgi:hypothetical protein